MSAVDWSQAPEGAVAHAVYHQHHANRGVWILIGHGPFSVNTTPVVADTYGLPPGLTMRPSAAEAELRAEVERLQASRSAEGDRLDWLLHNLSGSELRELVGDLSCTSDVAEWRAAIDRAAGFSHRQQPAAEPDDRDDDYELEQMLMDRDMGD